MNGDVNGPRCPNCWRGLPAQPVPYCPTCAAPTGYVPAPIGQQPPQAYQQPRAPQPNPQLAQNPQNWAPAPPQSTQAEYAPFATGPAGQVCARCGLNFENTNTAWCPRCGTPATGSSTAVKKCGPSPAGKRAKTSLIVAGVIIGALGLLVGLMNFAVYEALNSNNYERLLNYASLTDNLILVDGIATLVVCLVTWILFALWLHQRRTEAGQRAYLPSWKPGWAWGAWFVPVVALFVPFIMVRDTYKAYLTPQGQPLRQANLPHGGLWWGFFLAGGFVFNIASRAYDSTQTVQDFESLGTILLVTGFCYVISGCFYLFSAIKGAKMVGAIERAREQASHN